MNNSPECTVAWLKSKEAAHARVSRVLKNGERYSNELSDANAALRHAEAGFIDVRFDPDFVWNGHNYVRA